MRAYWRKVWLGFYTVLLGMKVTVKYLFSPSVTLQYPDEKWEIPDGNRGKLDVYLDDCIGCLQCSRACPAECITIETKKAPAGLDMGKTSDGTKKKLVVYTFDIDLTKCLFCGLCVEPCPTGCIRMTKAYEYSVYDRSELLLSFGKDLDPAVVAAAEKAAAERAAAEKAAAEKAAAEKGPEAKGEAEVVASGKAVAKARAGESPSELKPKPPGGTKAEDVPKPQPSGPESARGPETAQQGGGPSAGSPGEGKTQSTAKKAPEESASADRTRKGSTSSGQPTRKTSSPPGDSEAPSE